MTADLRVGRPPGARLLAAETAGVTMTASCRVVPASDASELLLVAPGATDEPPPLVMGSLETGFAASALSGSVKQRLLSLER